MKTVLSTIFWLTASLAYADEPCIPAGATHSVSFGRPPLEQDGVPADSGWQGGDGNPAAKEDDPLSDDAMGDAAGGDPASVPVSNDGGDLKGPNGTDQNGGTEGDCIEVKVCWTYWYLEETIPAWGYKLRDPITGSEGHVEHAAVRTYRTGTMCSEPKEVCPCP